MGYRSATSVTKPVALSQGYSAVVRALRAPEEDAVQAALLGGAKRKAKAQTGAAGQVNTDIDLEFDSAAQIEQTLLFGVVSWTLDGEPGDDVDAEGHLRITAANLQVLTGGDRNALYKAIDELTTPPGDDEKKG